MNELPQLAGGTAGKIARRLSPAASFRRLLDLVMPPQCLACDLPVATGGSLCPACWTRLKLIERPFCERLALPFSHDLGPGALSAEAIADPPPFDRLRAVTAFDDVARRLVHGLKYRNIRQVISSFRDWPGTG